MWKTLSKYQLCFLFLQKHILQNSSNSTVVSKNNFQKKVTTPKNNNTSTLTENKTITLLPDFQLTHPQPINYELLRLTYSFKPTVSPCGSMLNNVKST